MPAIKGESMQEAATGVGCGGRGEQNRQPAEENLRLEYEQTIQTLRNWDDGFLQVVSTLFLGGGIGVAVALLENDKAPSIHVIRVSVSMVVALFYLVALGYVWFTISIAATKLRVLQEIERRLSLVGAYAENLDGIRKKILRVLLPVCSGVALGVFLLIWFA